MDNRRRMLLSGGGNPFPEYTYTGNSEFIDDGDGNWRIKFLTSGNFTLLNKNFDVDIFLVGGGGAGSSGNVNGGGGGGGRTTTVKNYALNIKKSYPVTIGAGSIYGSNPRKGGTTYFDSVSALGGSEGRYNLDGSQGQGGGSGGSGGGGNHGGAGGSNGGSGSFGSVKGGTGQGTTTREFGEATGDLYAGGGGGSGTNGNYGGAGGAGGGGRGGIGGDSRSGNGGAGYSGTPNTGGGGGAGGNGYYSNSSDGYGGAGGSGIVIIRNARG